MNKYEKNKRNERIKETIKHVIHVVCYVLSVAFIVLMVIVGAQSCQKTSRQYAESDTQSVEDTTYILTPRVNSGSTLMLSLDDILNINTLLGVSNADQDDLGTIERYYRNVPNCKIYYDNEWQELSNIVFTFKTMENAREDNVYRFYALGFSINNTWLNGSYLSKTDEDGMNFEYLCSSFNVLLLARGMTQNELDALNYFYYINDYGASTQFVFNKTFNYNAPMLASLSSQFVIGNNWLNGWSYLTGFNYKAEFYADLPLFLSNNEVYNRLVYKIDRANENNTILIADGENNYYGTSTGDVYIELYYANTLTGVSTLVNKRNEISGYSSVYNKPYLAYDRSTTWISDNYRTIKFLNDSLLTENHRTILNAFNNNADNFNGFSDSTTYENIFTLIGGVFTAIMPIFNYTILPYITLGTLLFVPLVVILVFAIIRIIKK